MRSVNGNNKSFDISAPSLATRRFSPPSRPPRFLNRPGFDLTPPIDRVLRQLAGAQPGSGERQWVACCPSHADSSPSLSVREADDGRVLLYCHAGCELHEILDELQLEERDLFPRTRSVGPKPVTPNTSAKRKLAIEATTITPLQDLIRLKGPLRNAANAKEDWTSIAQSSMSALSSERRSKLAKQLGVLSVHLGRLNVGWYERPGQAGVYTFPEFNADGEIVGISTRAIDGTKKMLTGSERGLTIPSLISPSSGPILIVEGATDTAALLSMDLAGIGRPSAKGGVAQLAKLLVHAPPDIGILVVGEMDAKPSGDWPGRDGAQRVAEQLATHLNRKVQWAIVPHGVKDTRAWLQSHDDADRRQLGLQFVAAMREHSQDATPSDSLQFVDSRTFFTAEYKTNWHVKNVLVQGQPAILGGAKKVLKTNMLVDLVISVASGTPFLGQFAVTNRAAVGLISGESGEATIQETAKRICLTKGILEPETLPIQWCFRLPRLSVTEELNELGKLIVDHDLKLVVIDPLYLCLLAGNPDLQASNLFDVGPLLSDITATILGAGATPVFAHHNRKAMANAHEPPELEDLAFAGVQEFARQWLLVGRREKYEPGTGLHKLWLNVGGSAGHSGCWALDIDEGRLRDDFTGRQWRVTVRSAADERQDHAKQRERQKVQQLEAKVVADMATLTDVLRRHHDGETKSALAEKSGLGKPRVGRALEQLMVAGRVEETKIKKGGGRAQDRPYDGYRLVAVDNATVDAHEEGEGDD